MPAATTGVAALAAIADHGGWKQRLRSTSAAVSTRRDRCGTCRAGDRQQLPDAGDAADAPRPEIAEPNVEKALQRDIDVVTIHVEHPGDAFAVEEGRPHAATIMVLLALADDRRGGPISRIQASCSSSSSSQPKAARGRRSNSGLGGMGGRRFMATSARPW